MKFLSPQSSAIEAALHERPGATSAWSAVQPEAIHTYERAEIHSSIHYHDQASPTIEMGDTPAGNRRVFAVSGGEFAGGRIRGSVMPVIGSDLLLMRADGSAQQDVRVENG